MTAFLDSLFLTLHNLLRWAVLVGSIIAIVRAYRGWFGKKEWTKGDDRAGLLFVTLFDTQVLIGLILYFFFSAASQVTLNNFGAAMADPADRFFGLVHLGLMVVALAIAHVGRARTRKAADALNKHRQAALFFSVSVVIVMLAIPWEGLPDIGRPLFRLFGLAF